MQYKVNIYVWLIEGAMEEKPQLDLANSKSILHLSNPE